MLAGVILILGVELLKADSITGRIALLIALLIACMWQVSPWRQICLNHCHWVSRLSLYGLAADRDCLHFGFIKGFWCVGSCWALMFFPLVSGAAGLPLMLLITIYLFIEQYEPARPGQWGIPLLRKMWDENNY
jgi:predicted metal-binding membrane protein